MDNPISKFTLRQWVRHPTTIMLIIVTIIAYGVTWIYVRSQLEQVTYLRARVDKLESQIDDYTTTIMALRGANSKLADSLATKSGT